MCCSCTWGKVLLSCPLLCTQGSPRAVPVPGSTGTNGKGRRQSHEAVTCQSSRADCPHPGQLLGAKRLKLCPGLTKAASGTRAHPPQEAGWRQAAPCSSPVQHHPVAPASLQQHPACPARGQDALHLPSKHAAPRLQKGPRCPSDTHLFQLRKHHQVFCRERTPQPGTPTAAPGWSTGGRLGAPTPPQEPAEPVWVGSPAPHQGPPARGTQHPAVHLHGSAGCCLPPGAPLWGCWLRLSLLAHALKAHLACFGTTCDFWEGWGQT